MFREVIMVLYVLSSGGQPTIQLQQVGKYYESMQACENASYGVKMRMRELFSERAKDESQGMDHKCVVR